MIDLNSMTRRRFIAGASAAAMASPVLGQTQSSILPPVSTAKRSAEKLFATKPAPALSFAVARGEDIIACEAMGHADLELEVPATPAHSFPLGSVSKVITSTLAAKLVTSGTLDLDTPVIKWLPPLPEQHHKTTMRHLLTHRGGIRHYKSEEISLANPSGAIYMRLYPDDAKVLDLFIHDPLVAEPGTSPSYSSFGYTLASLVMQAAAGRPFLDLIDQQIAKPFRLTSLTPDNPWAIVPSRAGKYMNAQDVEMLGAGLQPALRPQLINGWAKMACSNPAYCWPGAGLLMAPSDAARFGAAMIETPQSKLTKQERELLFTPMTPATKQMPPLGLGWRISPDQKGRARWHHAGATGGGAYFLAVYPEQKMSVAIAVNVMSARINMNQAASDLIDSLL
ncbi:serine hydrolase domain-containing protein [Terriglobus albidus]|uniref:serine hydrolase domain-containing protein n=1 Tax=Terriglobus albidus TaxID=1592106 RepID=UPI0021DF6672|nr:serine hydrolase domain-containing protein [Terriglobus albidus]